MSFTEKHSYILLYVCLCCTNPACNRLPYSNKLSKIIINMKYSVKCAVFKKQKTQNNWLDNIMIYKDWLKKDLAAGGGN